MSFKEGLGPARNYMDVKSVLYPLFCLMLQDVVLLNKLLDCGYRIYVSIKKGVHALTCLCSRHTSQELSQET